MRTSNRTVARKLRAAGLAAVAALLVAPGASEAAVTIGSDLSNANNIALGCTNGETSCTDWQTALPGRQLTSPINGVVVRWRVRRGFLAGQMRLRVARPAGGTNYIGAGTSATVTPPPAVVSTHETRVPIMAGDYVGVDRLGGGDSGDIFFSGGGLLTIITEWSPAPADGVSTPTFAYVDRELLLNADIEADADGDGYGDESQDQCSTDASTQGPCASTTAPGSDTVPPVLSSVSLSNKTFRVDKKAQAAARRKAPKGTTFNYGVSEAATVTFTIQRKAKGRRIGTTCKRPSRKNRSKPRCTRYLQAGSFGQQANAGANQKPFSGKVGSKALRPASYRATLVAVDAAGNASLGTSIGFRVVRG